MTRERKIILIGGVILLLAGAVYRFYPEMTLYFGTEGAIAAKQEKVVKYRQMVAERKAATAQLEAMRGRLTALEAGLFEGETPALAAAGIQNTLTRIAEESGIEIATIRVMSSEKAENLPYVGIPVQLTFHAAIGDLKGFLYGIQNDSKLLRVSEAQIRSDRRGRSEAVQANLTVTGYAAALSPPPDDGEK